MGLGRRSGHGIVERIPGVYELLKVWGICVFKFGKGSVRGGLIVDEWVAYERHPSEKLKHHLHIHEDRILS